MALDLGELSVRLTAEDQLTNALNGAQQSARRTEQVTSQAATGITSATQRMAQGYQQLQREAQTYATASERANSRAETATDQARQAQERLDAAQRDSRTSASQLEAAQRDVASATDLAERSMRDAVTATDRMEAAHRRAARAAEQGGRDAVDALERTQRELRQTAQAAESAGEDAGSGFAGRFSGGLEGLSGAAGNAGSSTGGSFIAGFAPRVAGLGSKSGPIGVALAGVAVLGVAVGAALADAITQGMEFDAMSDQLQAKLGVDEETMRTIAKASGAAYGNVFGESVAENMDTARRAIQNGLLDPSDSANDMQPVIEQLDTVASLLESDIPEVAVAAGKMVRSGFVDTAVDALDLLAAAEQNNLAITGDLLDTMGEYSVQFAKVGLDGPTALGLISQAMQGGARDTDVAADAVKEFAIRAVDGTESTAEAYGKLGLNVEDTMAKLTEGGEAGTGALDSILDSLREMEPGVERNQVAAALFGTQWEDLAGAFDKFDVSSAAGQLGEVAGAAERAADTMAGNTKAKFEQAQRAVELSMSGVKMAIADGFMPSLDKAVDWVNTHQPEIIGFFTRLADAGFVTLDAILAFTSGSLRGLANWGEVVGATMGTALQAIGGFAEFAGGIVKHLPGMQDVGEAIEGAGEKTQWYADQVQSSSEKLNGLADMIDNARPGIQGMREDFTNAGEAAQLNAEMARALTDELNAVPDGKDIVIESNTPEQTAALEALGLKVTQMPDGKFRVTSNTDEGQKAIDAFVRANNDKNIDMFVDLRQRQIGYWESQGVSEADAPLMQGPVPITSNADGKLPDEALIKSAGGKGLVQWAEEGAGPWEAFIPGAESKRPRAVGILRDVADRFGYGLVQMADGGIVNARDLASSMAWAQSMDPAKYLMGGFSTDAIDCSGAVSGAVNEAVGVPAFDSRMSTVTEGPWLQAKGATLGRGGPGTLRIGWWDQGGGANGHTALTYPDGTNFESNGSEGVVVGGRTGADDPSFTNHAYFATAGDLGEPGSVGTVPNMNGANVGGTSLGRKVGTLPTSSGPVDVRVVNFSDLGGAAPDGRTPKAVGNLKVFANGGIESQNPEIANTGGNVRVWAEPQAGPWEAYIPGDPAKRARAVDIWRETGKRLNITEFADGGFGGYNEPKARDYMRPTNLMEAAALASGLGFTAASGIGGFLSMAQSGQVDLSQLMPQFDTGSNDIPGLSEAVIGRLDQLVELLSKGGLLTADVNVDTSNGNIGLQLMSTGLA
jgi:TP901 family phage tail tape measure protein